MTVGQSDVIASVAFSCPVREIVVSQQWGYSWVSFCPYETREGRVVAIVTYLSEGKKGLVTLHEDDPKDAQEYLMWIDRLVQYLVARRTAATSKST